MLLSALSFFPDDAGGGQTLRHQYRHHGTGLFARNLISMAISFCPAAAQSPAAAGRSKIPAEPCWPGRFSVFIGVVMLFYATAGARQADIAVLNRTSPIWVSLFALLILRERISKVQIGILLCLAELSRPYAPPLTQHTASVTISPTAHSCGPTTPKEEEQIRGCFEEAKENTLGSGGFGPWTWSCTGASCGPSGILPLMNQILMSTF